jgi:hypothetical protein
MLTNAEAVDAGAKALYDNHLKASVDGHPEWADLDDVVKFRIRNDAIGILQAAAPAIVRKVCGEIHLSLTKDIVKHETPGTPGRVAEMVLGLQRAERIVEDHTPAR